MTKHNAGSTREAHFDSDSSPLLIDKGTSASITTTSADFIDNPKLVRTKVNRISGNTVAMMKRTVRWKLEDDSGLVHASVLKNTYLIPGASTCVLSPQHMVQQANDNHPMVGGT